MAIPPMVVVSSTRLNPRGPTPTWPGADRGRGRTSPSCQQPGTRREGGQLGAVRAPSPGLLPSCRAGGLREAGRLHPAHHFFTDSSSRHSGSTPWSHVASRTGGVAAGGLGASPQRRASSHAFRHPVGHLRSAAGTPPPCSATSTTSGRGWPDPGRRPGRQRAQPVGSQVELAPQRRRRQLGGDAVHSGGLNVQGGGIEEIAVDDRYWLVLLNLPTASRGVHELGQRHLDRGLEVPRREGAGLDSCLVGGRTPSQRLIPVGGQPRTDELDIVRVEDHARLRGTP